MTFLRYLVRHGRTEYNAQERILGQSDPDLDGAGLAQAEFASMIIAAAEMGLSTDQIFSSPLKRARMTAETIGRKLGSPIEIRQDLAERDWGAWTGRPRGEIRAIGLEATPPDGEALSDFSLRVKTAWQSLPNGDRIVVVSHAGFFRSLLSHLQIQEIELPPGSVILLRQGAGGFQAQGPLSARMECKDSVRLPQFPMDFAAQAHGAQIRANGAPYINMFAAWQKDSLKPGSVI